MSPVIGLIFNVIILAALGVTIFFCLRLSRQFNQMRADRAAFEALIQGLNTAAARADGTIKAFREAAAASGDALQEKINKGRALSDELEIMVQAGDNLANRLQALAEKSRKATADVKPEPGEAHEDAPQQEGGAQPRTRAEKELMDAVRAKKQS